MSKFSSGAPRGTLLLALVLVLSTPVHAAASLEKDSSDKADFLFRVPKASFVARGGWSVASANSEIFVLVQDELTVEKGDFNAPILMSIWRCISRSVIQ